MYTPPKFCEKGSDKLFDFIAMNSFALVISTDATNGKIQHTQTPLILSRDRQRLFGHIAKANPHWRSWNNSEVSVVFPGAHTYISPSYYHSPFNVPTWNYQTVSVEGQISLIRDHATQVDLMTHLVLHHEKNSPEPWEFNPHDSRYDKLFEMIVFLEIEIRDIKATFKLNQNKSKEDQNSVINHLNSSKDSSHKQLIANAMQENLIT